jgi:YesN/AraC family two-component response regulator
VVLPEMAASHAQSYGGPALKSAEKKILEAIRESGPGSLEQALDTYFEEISKLRYNSILVGLLRLIVMINHYAEETGKSNSDLSLDNLTRNFFQIETLGDFRQELESVLAAYKERRASMKTSARHSAIVESVKSVINERYSDPNLCLDAIADMCKISSKHLSLIYKESEGKSVAEQINETRMAKAAELLVSSSLSIKEISAKIGMSNQTYFYSLFRKKHGVSPKTYSIMQALQQSRGGAEGGEEKDGGD